MPSDYEAITKHNERQLGLDTASRRTQISMYSDSTHFIYEILQNADDYGATEVEFLLGKKEIVISHNGKPFETENVKATTYFGKSTSKNDLVKTGRFGVGFKSVFAFTASPLIHSNDEDFEIYELYRLRPAERPKGFRKTQTVIILPFNHEAEKPDYIEEYMTAEESYKKISNRLATLNMNTLLFTQNLKEIRWETSSKKGHYLREDKRRDGCRWTTITDGNILNKYLVFSRIPTWHNQGYKPVEVAFGLDEKDKLTTVDDYLYVLFSTTQETHLQFILNGPYRTNPSRETIAEDDQFNVHLIKETATLLSDILPKLRDMGLLTIQALSVFPNPTDKKIRHFYEPLRTAIVDCFKVEELVPTDSNGFARATEVFQGPALVREIIISDDLSFLSEGESAVWAKGIQQNSRPDQFLRGLDIDQWGWNELQAVLNDKFSGQGYFLAAFGDISTRIETNFNYKQWLRTKPDAWMQKFYLRLGEAIKKGDCSEWTLKKCRIIRVRENGIETHVAGNKAYFPKGRGFKELPQVKSAILRARNSKTTKEIEESLIALGVSQIGDEERIDLLLETYYGGSEVAVTSQQNLSHMDVFIKWWRKERSALKFRHYPIFLSVGAESLHKGNECYLDAPLHKSGLSVVYEDRKCPLDAKARLWAGYKKVDEGGFCDFAVACGVADCLAITEIRCWEHPDPGELFTDISARNTHTGLNEDFTIKGLCELFDMKKREVNLLIWNIVSKADPEVLEARYCPNKKCELRHEKSSLVIRLSRTAWIPNKRGSKMLPAEISKEQLHRDFKYDNRNGWLDAIGFGDAAKKESDKYQKKKEMADGLGIPVEMAEFISQLSAEEREQTKKEMVAWVKKKKAARKKQERIQKENISYHDGLENAFSAQGKQGQENSSTGGGETRNPARRRKKTKEEINAAIENEGRSGSSFSFKLRKKWKGKSDKVRTALADWYGGKCQICGETFIQRSGEPYFEGLYLVPHTKAEWLDRVGNVLCLCPLHSAMFQYGEKNIEYDIIQTILDLKILAEGGDASPMLPMTLCGKNVQIKFKDNHLLDLQEMIKASDHSGEEG